MAQKIIVASGIELRDTLQGVSLIKLLNEKADAGKDSTWTFPKGAKGAKTGKVTHEVKVVFESAGFAAALDTADAFVVYSGHSRYGQGPAFGPSRTPHVPDKKQFPINPWGVHFRMGYDATDTEAVGDLVGHSVIPVEYDLTTAPAKAYLPAKLVAAAARAKAVEAQRKKGKSPKASSTDSCPIAGGWRELDTCWAKIAATKTARGDEPLKGRHYYAYMPHYEAGEVTGGRDEFFVSVKVGSADLDASSLKCKLLFMASCSAHEHYHGPLTKRRKDAKSSCKFYLTHFVNTASNARNFLEGIFKGIDPLSRKGSKAMLKLLNGYKDAGVIGMY